MKSHMSVKRIVFNFLMTTYVLVEIAESIRLVNGALNFGKYDTYSSVYNYTTLQRIPTGRYQWKEHARVHFTCPMGYYISNISYSYDLDKDTVTKEFQTWSVTDTWVIKNKIAKFRRYRRERNSIASIFTSIFNKTKSSASKTGCDAVLLCLGYQACLFQLSMELCADDPDSLDVKYLKLELNCAPDLYYDEDIQSLSAEQKNTLSNSKNNVMYIYYDKEKTNDLYTEIKCFVLPEKEVFWINCPPTKNAHSEGYGGWCQGPSPKQEQIATELWHIIARSTDFTCRDELLQVYCAYHYNFTGGCVPPIFVEKPKNGSILRPGQMRFSFRALPTTGKRPSMQEFYTVRKNPHSKLIPVKFAFLVIAHTCEDCVMQLLGMIYRPYFFYVIHVDYRQDSVRNELKRRLNSNYYQNVRVLPKQRSFTASWGSFNILRAELEGIEELARMGVWDFVINLSGADLPYTDVDDMAAIYASYRSRNFMNAREKWTDRKHYGKDTAVWYACNEHVYNVTSRGAQPKWSTQLSGSQWFILDRGFAVTIIDQKRRAKRLNKIQFFQQSCIVPDESYLQSMLFNSDFRSTYIFDRSRLYMFPKSTKDERGLCKHSSDIDYCGQSPSNFKNRDIKFFKGNTKKYNFGRKFEYNVTHETRVALVDTLNNSEMYKFVKGKGSVTNLFIRQLVEEAMNQKFGRKWVQQYKLEEIIKVRILRVPTADNECCKPIHKTRNTLPYRYKYWIDFSMTKISTEATIFMRTCMKPIDTVKCFVKGHIKAISVTFNNDPFIPHESDTDRPLQYTIFFNRALASRNVKCKDLPNPTSVIFEFLPFNNSTQFNYVKLIDSQTTTFNVMLISPSGDELCEWSTQISMGTSDRMYRKNTHHKIIMKSACTEFTPGWWRLVLQEKGIKNAFPYTAYMFVGHSGGTRQANEDNIKGLWNLEGMMELSNEDILLQSKWSRVTPFDRPDLGKGIIHGELGMNISTKSQVNKNTFVAEVDYKKNNTDDQDKLNTGYEKGKVNTDDEYGNSNAIYQEGKTNEVYQEGNAGYQEGNAGYQEGHVMRRIRQEQISALLKKNFQQISNYHYKIQDKWSGLRSIVVLPTKLSTTLKFVLMGLVLCILRFTLLKKMRITKTCGFKSAVKFLFFSSIFYSLIYILYSYKYKIYKQ